MNHAEKKFTHFVNTSLKVLFLLIIIGSTAVYLLSFINLSFKNIVCSVLGSLILFSACVLIGYIIYKLSKNGCSNKMILLIILLLAFFLRLLYILLVDVKPFSDFGLIYRCGQKFASHDYSVFKGTSYIARFPHLTILTIYFGMMVKIFPNALFAIKLTNVILSTISVYIIYLISKNVCENSENVLMVSFTACIFPPFIFYNSVLCSENLAIPFFLISIYLFIMTVKSKKSSVYILSSGLALSIGNLFRMVGIIMLIAYILYLIIYCRNKSSIKKCILLAISFFIPLIIANTVLLKSNITQYPLWHGREPVVTSILKGTNIKSIGMWNKEDSEIPKKCNYNYDKTQAVSMSIIKERLTKTPLPELIAFYVVKFIAQWSSGDFAGAFWSTGDLSTLSSKLTLSTILFLYAQILYIILMISIYMQLFRAESKKDSNLINLVYIIFCGFGLFYLMIEQQQRYAYIVSWIFILLLNGMPLKRLKYNLSHISLTQSS